MNEYEIHASGYCMGDRTGFTCNLEDERKGALARGSRDCEKLSHYGDSVDEAVSNVFLVLMPRPAFARLHE